MHDSGATTRTCPPDSGLTLVQQLRPTAHARPGALHPDRSRSAGGDRGRALVRLARSAPALRLGVVASAAGADTAEAAGLLRSLRGRGRCPAEAVSRWASAPRNPLDPKIALFESGLCPPGLLRAAEAGPSRRLVPQEPRRGCRRLADDVQRPLGAGCVGKQL